MGRICTKCGQDKSTAHYIGVNSPFFNGCLPICRQCLSKKIEESNGDWNVVDKILQWADIPFIPEKWEEIYDSEGSDALGVYISIFRQRQYSQLDWSQYQKVYEELDENNSLTNVLPKLQAKQVNELRKKWGQHYNEEELEYLENLHIGLTQSQNIVGALNENQALMLCKITLVIEEKIRAGEDFSKELKSYDELAKLANLTPKTIKDSEEIESVGELFCRTIMTKLISLKKTLRIGIGIFILMKQAWQKKLNKELKVLKLLLNLKVLILMRRNLRNIKRNLQRRKKSLKLIYEVSRWILKCQIII